ncbi:MAG: ABC transporter transmembrane domain-containing protein, partial [Ardenticatenia bacterium]|nr:ABC transporter transmembrane domain-containing protein [Ardenticatenia bacterium]
MATHRGREMTMHNGKRSHIPTPTEFTPPVRYATNRRGPVRWLLSHVRRYPLLLLFIFVGALGNAALAAAVPVLLGRAFNAMATTPPKTELLLPTALAILGAQVTRSALQFLRNFSAELVGQRLERDIRDELYTNLLGKSMAFHNAQPVGDTMARATND